MRTEEAIMSTDTFNLNVEETKAVCPIGEKYGKRCSDEGKIPVISCEGSCIRGEIARLAANMIAKHEPYGRGCHGEIFTAPNSAIANWARTAKNIVVVDGCFMKCHGRIMNNIVGEAGMAHFDALAIYNKYTDLMDIDDVPEQERKATAEQVATIILNALQSDTPATKTVERPVSCTQCSSCK
jgi:uncharacterized metal-binding protein